MWLLNTYAIPAGMYASQVWATPFLQQGKKMDNPLQKWLVMSLSTVLKRILMVTQPLHAMVCHALCGLEPLQFNWLRAAMQDIVRTQVRFSIFAKMGKASCCLLMHQVLTAQVPKCKVLFRAVSLLTRT